MLASPLLGAAILKLTASLTDQVFVHGQFQLLTSFILFYALAVVARAALGFARDFLDTWNVGRISQEVRIDAYRRLLAAGEDSTRRASVGELISTLSSDCERIAYLVYSGPLGFVAKCLSAAVYGSLMFMLNWKLTLVAILVAPLLWLLKLAANRNVRRVAHANRRLRARVPSIIEERLNAVRLVREYQSLERETAFFTRRTRQAFRGEIRSMLFGARIGGVSQAITFVGAVAVMWLGATEIQAGRLSVGALVAFLGSIGSLQSPLSGMARSATRFAKARVSAERLESLTDQAPEIAERADARPLRRGPGAIELQGVSFAYPERPTVLDDISLRIAPGETVAIVGASGAGKSTLISLLGRRRDPTEGAVLIDGEDLRGATFASIADAVRVVDQDPLLLKGTVLDNIRYGNPSASRAAVEDAIDAAGGRRFIDSLPRGLATGVGARGKHLSGGQRQRIALARALVTDCRVLVLDEATAAVDSETEAMVREALQALRGRRSLILISHRLSSIRHAGRVLVLDHGRIVEEGAPDRLLAAGGRFAELFADQVTTPTSLLRAA
jgi:subfamily B ATP-binding cassette protein MsbA